MLKDIKFDSKELKINKNVVNIPGENLEFYNIMTPKTKSSIRTLPIPKLLLNCLKSLLNENKKIYYVKKRN